MVNMGNWMYGHDDVITMLKSNRAVDYLYELQDRNGRAIGNISAEGTVDQDSRAEIKRVASLSIREEKDIDFLSDRVKPYMVLEIPEGRLKFPLGVFIMSSPSRKSSGGIISREIDCYDMTQVLKDDKFDTRYLVTAGTNYIAAVADIIESSGIEDYQLTASGLELPADMEFEIGETKLGAVNRLLQAINYNELYAGCTGTIYARPYEEAESRNVEFAYSTDRMSIVLPGAEELLDVFEAPNKIVRYLENPEMEPLVSVVTNTDPKSRLSTVSRGRTIVDVEAVKNIAGQATLDAYTQRIAAERKIYQEIIFTSGNMPHHECLDCLYVNNKELGISGKFIEIAWTMNLKTGGEMKHTCRRAVAV